MDYRFQKLKAMNEEAESIIDLTFDGESLHARGQENDEDRAAVQKLRNLVQQYLAGEASQDQLESAATTLLGFIEKAIAAFKENKAATSDPSAKAFFDENMKLYKQAHEDLEDLLDSLDSQQLDILSEAMLGFQESVRAIDQLLESQK